MRYYLLFFIVCMLYCILAQDIKYCVGDCQLINGICTPKTTSVICNPVIQNGVCPNGCKNSTNGITCINNYYVYPIKTLFNPINCNNTNTYGCYTDGTLCPMNCEYSKCNDYCTPIIPGAICKQKNIIKCPYNCTYDQIKRLCQPIAQNVICKAGQASTTCPYGCIFDTIQHKCITHSNNITCELKHDILCPYGCYSNGTTCTTQTNILCDITNNPICPKKCKYDYTYHKCIPLSLNNSCNNLIRLTCPQNYFFEVTAPTCTIYNQNIMCMSNQSIFQIPYNDYYNDYHNIKNLQCRYAANINCTSFKATIKTCPIGCIFDQLLNKCTSNNESIICGSVDLQCPLNYTRTLFGSCIPRISNNTLQCQDGYKLMNIFTPGKNYTTWCAPVWYFVNYIHVDNIIYNNTNGKVIDIITVETF